MFVQVGDGGKEESLGASIVRWKKMRTEEYIQVMVVDCQHIVRPYVCACVALGVSFCLH